MIRMWDFLNLPLRMYNTLNVDFILYRRYKLRSKDKVPDCIIEVASDDIRNNNK
jgi:hypothetical protein